MLRLDTLKNKKRIIGITFLMLLIFSSFPQFSNVARAQAPQSPQSSPSACWNVGGEWDSQSHTCQAAGTAKAQDEAWSFDWCSVVGVSSVCDAVKFVMFIPLTISAWLLWLSGQLLNLVIDYSVVGVYDAINNIGGINVAWAVIRDLVNISLIFILLYTAIMVILDRGGNGVIKQAIVGVVLVAILINFSMFFSKVIVDASNITSLTFYNAASSCNGAGNKVPVSDCFAKYLGLNTVYKTPSQDLLTGVGSNFAKTALVSIGGSIFILLAAFVFLAASVMFIVRFVTIVFLLIFSPLMFIGLLLPGLKQTSGKWWSSMMDQALFAPVFMILVWVVLAILGTIGFSGAELNSNNALANVFTGNNSGISMVLNFAIIITFIIGVLTVSKSFSKTGGALGGKFAGTVMGGVGGYVGRRTLGSVGRSIADSEKLKEKASQKGLGGAAARLALRAGQGTAKSSFDIRGAKIPGTSFGIPRELGAGKAGGKGGYDAYIKKKAEDEKKFGESLKPSDITVDKAKQELAAAKLRRGATDIKDTEKYRKAIEAEKSAQEKLDALVGVKAKDRIKEIEERRGRKIGEIESSFKSDLDASTKKVSDLEKELEEKRELAANTKIVQLKDQREEELKAIEQSLVTAKEELGLIKNNQDSAVGAINAAYEAEKAGTKDLKGAADRRKLGYADVLAGQDEYNPFLGTNWSPGTKRVGLIGRFKRQNLQAAAMLRGTGGKSKKERLADLAREVQKESDDSEGETKGGDGGEENKPKDESGDKK